MSKMYDFLIKMSKDLALQRAYVMDSNAVMKEHGLTSAEQDAVLSADIDRIHEVGGSRGLIICKIIDCVDPEDEAPRKKKT